LTVGSHALTVRMSVFADHQVRTREISWQTLDLE